MRKLACVIATALCLGPTLAGGAPAGGGGPAAGAGAGQTPVEAPEVRPEFAAFGTVFYVNDGRGRDAVSFTSEAPLEDIVGTTNQIKGYVVFDPQNPANGGRGEFVVPVARLETGIPMRDQHLQSAQWLNAEANPLIRYVIEDVRDIQVVSDTEEAKTYSATLSGPFTVNGQTKPIEASARVTYMPASEKTRARLPGNLLAGRAEFTVALSDFGVSGAGDKVSNTIEVEVRFVGTDQKPEAGAGRMRQGGGAPAGGQ